MEKEESAKGEGRQWFPSSYRTCLHPGLEVGNALVISIQITQFSIPRVKLHEHSWLTTRHCITRHATESTEHT